jgi:adenosylmethionine---8-amino-7-oxononanoate aminotransferase
LAQVFLFSYPYDERDVKTEQRRGDLGTARRKGRQQITQTYCHRASSRLYHSPTKPRGVCQFRALLFLSGSYNGAVLLSTSLKELKLESRDRRHLWLPYTPMKTERAPLGVARTCGSRIVLDDGRQLIDGIASWWTAAHGYNHPHIRDCVARQLERMPHVMLGGLVHEPATTLCRRLAELLPGDLNHVFLSDSGSVAVEVAMKMATQFWLNRDIQGRTKFLAFKGGYHGDTFAAMSVCDPEEGMHSLFADVFPAQLCIDLPRDAYSRAAFVAAVDRHADVLAAILIEPLVQGAGGMLFHDAEVLRCIREVADAHGLLVIFDEIFTGFGRTGSAFACQSAGVVPDIITLGKALTGGTLPLAATIANSRVFDAFWSDDSRTTLMHGPTFMGNALACAAANASLDLFEREDRLSQVRSIEHQLRRELEPCHQLCGVKEVRVRGAIGVVELDNLRDLPKLKQRFIDVGVWLRPFRNVVYLTPALNISPDDLTALTSVVVRVLGERAP